MDDLLLTYEGPASGLETVACTIIGPNGIVRATSTEGVTELVAGSGVYGLLVAADTILEQGAVAIWTPGNGELGSVQGPWDKWSAE